jgi:microcystin-dependent protein
VAHTNSWDETTPTNTTNATDIDDHIRKVRLDLRERLAIDHKFESSDAGGVQFGVHKKVTFEDPIAEPTLAAGESCLYPETGDKVCELRYLDSRGIAGLLTFVGEVRMRLGSAVPDGWLALNGDTIGDSTSGADHAGDNYEELYKFLYGELAQTEFFVTGGRGASADADWTAHKKAMMPDARSRVPMGVGASDVAYIRFTSGGTHQVIVGDTLTGATSGATAIVSEVIVDEGTWAAGTAKGYFVLNTVSGTFQAENLNEGGNNNVCTIASDLYAYTTRVIGRLGGIQETDSANHTHAVGSYTVPAHNHWWYDYAAQGKTFNSGGSAINITSAQPACSTGNKSIAASTCGSDPSVMTSTVGVDGYTNNQAATGITGTSATGGVGPRNYINPHFVVAYIIRY